MARKPFACRALGHRWRFWREDRVVRWACARGCEAGGSRAYRSAQEAKRYLRHFDRAPRPPGSFLAALAGSVVRDPRRKG